MVQARPGRRWRPPGLKAPAAARVLRCALLATAIAGCAIWGSRRGELKVPDRRAPHTAAGPPRASAFLFGDGHSGGHAHQEHGEHGHHHESLEETLFEVISHPRMLVGEIFSVVLLSAAFEEWEHRARHGFAARGDKTTGKILDLMFKEFTILGFIAFLLYVVIKSGGADWLANRLLEPEDVEKEDEFIETFETVHMVIFLLLIVLLLQAWAMQRNTHKVAASWVQYEHTRAFGTPKDSLESMFVEHGYLARVIKPKAPRGMVLAHCRDFSYGSSFFQRILLRQDPLHQLVMWRSLRHEFLFPRDGSTPAVPNPALFSFGAYLRGRLGKTVLAIVELDMLTWFLTLLLLVPILILCMSLSFVAIEILQCVLCWMLLVFAMMLTWKLEEDTHQLTPQVPRDPRFILRLFAGTAFQAMMRQLTPEVEDEADVLGAAPTAKRSKSWLMDLRMGAPGLDGVEDRPKVKIGVAPARHVSFAEKEGWPMWSPARFSQLFRLLAFWQAISVTCLILSFFCKNITGLKDATLYIIAWAEWPCMVFWLFPRLVRMLTIRNSIGDEKDEHLIREVDLSMKEGILRDHVRLIQLMNFYRNAVARDEAWLNSGTPHDAAKMLRTGLRLFEALPTSEQDEIWAIFSTWDVDNDHEVHADDLKDIFTKMGFYYEAQPAAESLLRLVDDDGTEVLSWEKFQAMLTLATIPRPEEQLHDDLEAFFTVIDKNRDNRLSVFELAEWVQSLKTGMTEEDIANMLYKYFGQAKPTVTLHEFVAWIRGIMLNEVHHEGNGSAH